MPVGAPCTVLCQWGWPTAAASRHVGSTASKLGGSCESLSGHMPAIASGPALPAGHPLPCWPAPVHQLELPGLHLHQENLWRDSDVKHCTLVEWVCCSCTCCPRPSVLGGTTVQLHTSHLARCGRARVSMYWCQDPGLRWQPGREKFLLWGLVGVSAAATKVLALMQLCGDPHQHRLMQPPLWVENRHHAMSNASPTPTRQWRCHGCKSQAGAQLGALQLLWRTHMWNEVAHSGCGAACCQPKQPTSVG